jgi:hypothetical protein
MAWRRTAARAADDGLWLALVEVRPAPGRVLYAAEVEGALAWTAADASDAGAAKAAIRDALERRQLRVRRFEAVFEADIETIAGYDRHLARCLASQSSPDGHPRTACGTLHYFAAEAEA